MAAVEQVDSRLEEKKLATTERLQKRQEAREVEIQKKRESEGEKVSRQKSVTNFIENLNKQRQSIEDGVAQSNQLDKCELVNHFDSLSDTLHKVQRYVSECTAFLPSFEIRKAQKTISNLQNQIQEKRDELLPKKKFAFRKAKKPVEKKVEHLQQENATEPDEIDSVVELAACKFIKQTGQTLTKESTEINQKDVALVELTDCTIRLYGAPSAIHIFNLKNCRIFSGPVSGSIFMRACTDCVFVFACQQLRIHNTYDTSFYIHVTSKAIIEDCSRVGFAPYNWEYPALDSHYQVSGLDRSRNNWDQVDDFNFLAAGVASPNWSVIEESKRTASWDE